jgi:hypothetical protein
MTFDQLHDLKVWHSRHVGDRPVEGHVWNAVLTLWLFGWVGVPAAWLLGRGDLALAGLVLLPLPGLYVALRRALHRRRLLRCDWIAALG